MQASPSSVDMSQALDRAGDDLETLLRLLEQEFDTLKRRDIDAFESTQEDKNRLLVELAALAGIGLKDEHMLPLLQGETGAADVGFEIGRAHV